MGWEYKVSPNQNLQPILFNYKEWLEVIQNKV